MTDSQHKKIKEVLNNPAKVTTLKDSEDRHQFVLNWNWDDGVKPLQWIVEQPDTDKGTAVHIYWLSDPAYFHGLMNMGEVSSEHQEMVTLISTIEENVKKNFYKNENILFDPANDSGLDHTKENTESIPKEMLQATTGTAREMADLVEQYVNKIYPLTEEKRKTLEKNLSEGFTALQNFDNSVSQESSPDEIVTVLQKLSNSYRSQNKEKFTPQESKMFKQLDYVWAEQVCRQYGYQWYLHELHEQILDFIDFIILSPDKKYYWSDFGQLMKHYSKTTGDTPFIIEKFEMFKDLDTQVQKKIEEYKKDHPEDTPTDRIIYLRPYPDGISSTEGIETTLGE